MHNESKMEVYCLRLVVNFLQTYMLKELVELISIGARL